MAGDAATAVDGNVYAIILRYPSKDLALGAPEPTVETKISLLGFGELKV